MLDDEDATKQSGIISYLLSDRTFHDEKALSIRTFTLQQKRRVYEKQEHHCSICLKHNCFTEYAFEEMEGDHIKPWSKGGQTTSDNLQLLCKTCNIKKSNYDAGYSLWDEKNTKTLI